MRLVQGTSSWRPVKLNSRRSSRSVHYYTLVSEVGDVSVTAKKDVVVYRAV